MVVVRGWDGGKVNAELALKGDRVSVLNKKFWRWMVVLITQCECC